MFTQLIPKKIKRVFSLRADHAALREQYSQLHIQSKIILKDAQAVDIENYSLRGKAKELEKLCAELLKANTVAKTSVVNAKKSRDMYAGWYRAMRDLNGELRDTIGELTEERLGLVESNERLTILASRYMKQAREYKAEARAAALDNSILRGKVKTSDVDKAKAMDAFRKRVRVYVDARRVQIAGLKSEIVRLNTKVAVMDGIIRDLKHPADKSVPKALAKKN